MPSLVNRQASHHSLALVTSIRISIAQQWTEYCGKATSVLIGLGRCGLTAVPAKKPDPQNALWLAANILVMTATSL